MIKVDFVTRFSHFKNATKIGGHAWQKARRVPLINFAFYLYVWCRYECRDVHNGLEVSMFHTESSWNAVDYLIHGKPLSKLYQLLNSCIVYNRNNSPGHMCLHCDQTGQIFSIISWWITAYIYSNVDIVVPLSPVHFEPRKKLCKFLFSWIYGLWIIAKTSCAVYVHMRRLSLIHILYIFIVKYKC